MRLMRHPRCHRNPQKGEHGSNARDVACRSIDARYETRADRIASAEEHNRNCLGCSLCCERRGKKIRGDNRYPIGHQLGRQRRQAIIMTIRRTVFDRHVLALDEADLAQTFPEGIRQRQWLRRSLVEKSYHGERLLRVRRQWPRRCCTAEQRDELAALQLIRQLLTISNEWLRLRSTGSK